MWSWTYHDISVCFFVFSFGLSLVDCTSSVTFLPFMANFRPCYLTPYLVGEGLSGLVPSLVAIAQGIENPECVNETRTSENMTTIHLVPRIVEPRFSAEVFFASPCSSLVGSVSSCWTSCHSAKHKISCSHGTNPAFEMSVAPLKSDEHLSLKIRHRIDNSRIIYFYLLFLQGWASIATFGIFPAIQPYSCLPYGDTPYHWAVTLCGIAYPAACLLAVFCEVRKVLWLTWLSVAATVISVYAMTTSVLSPHPPLLDSPVGPYLIVMCWVVFMFMFSYIKTMATVLLGDHYGHRALFWCGAVTQGGAVVGTGLMFLLVNVFNLFHDEGMCM